VTKTLFAEVVIFSIILSHAHLMAPLSLKLSNAANLLRILPDIIP
jgi:hypothetical protein